MGPTLRRVIASSLVAAVIGALVFGQAATAAALTDGRRAARAVGFIATKQRANGSVPAFSPIGSTADAVLATVAAGRGRDVETNALAYLRTQVIARNVTTIGLRAKVALAVAAAGLDPANFGFHNLIHGIRLTMGGDGHFGEASVFDQALAILAIEAAGLPPRPEAIAWLENAQCPDGGWQFDAPYDAVTEDAHCVSGPSDFSRSDSNTTSVAVQAIEAYDSNTVYPASPFTFFSTMRDPTHGGWSYTPELAVTDANSTALVIQAFKADHRSVPTGGLVALRALQYAGCGAFAFTWDGDTRTGVNLGATIGAVPALMLRPMPFTGPVVGNAPAFGGC